MLPDDYHYVNEQGVNGELWLRYHNHRFIHFHFAVDSSCKRIGNLDHRISNRQWS